LFIRYSRWWSLWLKIGTNSYLSLFSFISTYRATYEAGNKGKHKELLN